ncbi:MAG: hypothetical protein IKI74_03145 [Christensenellaceae bacterium]|nr:hypothetical protein [Christensenellaceae bacterium]
MKNVFLTCIKNGFDTALADIFRKNGWNVYFGEGLYEGEERTGEDLLSYLPSHISMFIDTSRYISPADDAGVRDGLSREAISASFTENYIKPVRYLEQVISVMEDTEPGEDCPLKRIVFINTEESSVNWNSRTKGYGYAMARAALNNTVSTFVNKLLPLGYTFRMFDPMYDRVPAELSAASAFGYLLRDRCDDDGDPRCQDERRLVIRDARGREIPW